MCLHTSLLVCNVSFMTSRRTPQTGPAAAVAAAIAKSNTPVSRVAEAADLTTTSLDAFLDGTADITVESLVKVGGFLRLPTSATFGAAA